MQKQPSEGFFKDGVMRNFWNLFFDKVKLCRSVTSLKTSLAQVFSCEFCEICKSTFFAEHHRTTTSDYTVFSPINGHSKGGHLSVADNFFSPAEFWSKSHENLSKRWTGN